MLLVGFGFGLTLITLLVGFVGWTMFFSKNSGPLSFVVHENTLVLNKQESTDVFFFSNLS